MKKTIYEAPMMEQIQVRFEQNIMSDAQASVKRDMNVWSEQEI